MFKKSKTTYPFNPSLGKSIISHNLQSALFLNLFLSAFLRYPTTIASVLFTSPRLTLSQYLHMAWGVSPMMMVVCLLWSTILVLKVTGWSALGFSSVTVEGKSSLSGWLCDRLWYNQTRCGAHQIITLWKSNTSNPKIKTKKSRDLIMNQNWAIVKLRTMCVWSHLCHSKHVCLILASLTLHANI